LEKRAKNIIIVASICEVAGTIAGSGAGNSAAKGMGPAVNVKSYDWTNDTSEAVENIVGKGMLHGELVGVLSEFPSECYHLLVCKLF